MSRFKGELIKVDPDGTTNISRVNMLAKEGTEGSDKKEGRLTPNKAASDMATSSNTMVVRMNKERMRPKS